MLDEFVEFLEGAFVEEEVDAFAGGELAFFVLALAAVGTTAVFSGLMTAAKFGKRQGRKGLVA